MSADIKKLNSSHGKSAYSLLSRVDGLPTWSLTNLTSFLGKESSAAWGLYNDQALSSFVLFQVAGDEAEILLIATLKVYQRKGFATMLLNDAVQELKKAGTKSVFLEVSAMNKAAIVFYLSKGFKVVGNRKNYYSASANRDALIMSRLL